MSSIWMAANMVKQFGIPCLRLGKIWMCGPDADEFLGKDVSLREEGIRKRVGLI